MNIYLQWLGRHWLAATLATLVVLMVLKKLLGDAADGISLNWLLAGAIVCITVGQILTHYTRLKLLGFVTTLIGAGAVGVWLYSFMPTSPALPKAPDLVIPTSPELPKAPDLLVWFSNWTAIQFGALVATLVIVSILLYGMYRIYADGPGNTAKYLAYGFLTVCVIYGISYFVFEEEIVSNLLKFFQENLQDSAKLLTEKEITSPSTPPSEGKEESNWKLSSFWQYTLFGLGIIVGLIMIFWPNKTTISEKKGH